MSGSEFVCHDEGCGFRTLLVYLAENHERRTGHDVWEVSR